MNYILIATSKKGAVSYVSSTRSYGSLCTDANDAARFVQASSAETAIKDLRTKDFENRNKVTLSYGRVQTTIVETFELKAPKAKEGFVIKFLHPDSRGPYSKCPRNPKDLDFSHVQYSSTPNIDKATRYATEEEAIARVDAMVLVLKDTVARSGNHAQTYQNIVDRFSATVVKV